MNFWYVNWIKLSFFYLLISIYIEHKKVHRLCFPIMKKTNQREDNRKVTWKSLILYYCKFMVHVNFSEVNYQNTSSMSNGNLNWKYSWNIVSITCWYMPNVFRKIFNSSIFKWAEHKKIEKLITFWLLLK